MNIKPASSLLLLYLLALVIFLLATLTTPLVRALNLSSLDGVDFGVFGYCVSGHCSAVKPGYSIDALTPSDSHAFSLSPSTRHNLSGLLIVHPIAALFILIQLCLAISAHFTIASSSLRFLLVFALLSIPTLLACILAFLVDLFLFVPHLSWVGWLTLPATIFVTTGCFVTWGMRRTLAAENTDNTYDAERGQRQKSSSTSTLNINPASTATDSTMGPRSLPEFEYFDETRHHPFARNRPQERAPPPTEDENEGLDEATIRARDDARKLLPPSPVFEPSAGFRPNPRGMPKPAKLHFIDSPDNTPARLTPLQRPRTLSRSPPPEGVSDYMRAMGFAPLSEGKVISRGGARNSTPWQPHDNRNYNGELSDYPAPLRFENSRRILPVRPPHFNERNVYSVGQAIEMDSLTGKFPKTEPQNFRGRDTNVGGFLGSQLDRQDSPSLYSEPDLSNEAFRMANVEIDRHRKNSHPRQQIRFPFSNSESQASLSTINYPRDGYFEDVEPRFIVPTLAPSPASKAIQHSCPYTWNPEPARPGLVARRTPPIERARAYPFNPAPKTASGSQRVAQTSGAPVFPMPPRMPAHYSDGSRSHPELSARSREQPDAQKHTRSSRPNHPRGYHVVNHGITNPF
ncbi:MAG: regulator of ime2 [Trizodia sp. TS-e1964]|nr:MAG: regulator of ime2 [Trizodia sp. TS-e1964]